MGLRAAGARRHARQRAEDSTWARRPLSTSKAFWSCGKNANPGRGRALGQALRANARENNPEGARLGSGPV